MDVLINIDVSDLAAAERFYTRTFDLRPGRRLGDTIVELVGGPSSIFLYAIADCCPDSTFKIN